MFESITRTVISLLETPENTHAHLSELKRKMENARITESAERNILLAMTALADQHNNAAQNSIPHQLAWCNTLNAGAELLALIPSACAIERHALAVALAGGLQLPRNVSLASLFLNERKP